MKILLFLMIFVPDLSTPVLQEGSLIREVYRLITLYTSRPVLKGESKELIGHWTEAQDKFGTIIFSKDISFDNFYKFVSKQFGAPHKAGFDGKNQQYVIPAKVAGVAMWFSEHNQGLQIVVNKPYVMVQP